MEDCVVLSYQDSVLRKSDISLLDGCGWLNDRLIGFWFEYLHHEIYDCEPSILLISPEVAHFIKLSSQEEVNLFMEPLELSKKKLILLAVNDSVSLDCPGGTHWSLLVYDALSRRFYHLDSLTAINHSHAVNVSRKLGFLSSEFIELSSSQQNNSWDCGVYVCCHAELVLKHRFCKNESLIKTLPLLQDSDVKYYRKKTRALIESLGKMK